MEFIVHEWNSFVGCNYWSWKVSLNRSNPKEFSNGFSVQISIERDEENNVEEEQQDNSQSFFWWRRKCCSQIKGPCDIFVPLLLELISSTFLILISFLIICYTKTEYYKKKVDILKILLVVILGLIFDSMLNFISSMRLFACLSSPAIQSIRCMYNRLLIIMHTATTRYG